MSDRVGTTIRAHCSQCGGDRNCEIKGHLPQRGGDENYQWYVDWFLLVCRGCDYVFAQTVASNSEDYSQYYDHEGNTVTEHDEVVEVWPSRLKRTPPEWFEHSIVETDIKDTGALNSSLKELYKALNEDLLVLASIGVRTSLDIASELLGIESSLRFDQKVTALIEGGHIPQSERETIELLIDAGSASAHRGWQPKAEDVAALMTSLEEFINQSMVIPARKRAHAEKLAALAARVPPKKPKVKVPGDQPALPAPVKATKGEVET